MKFMTQKQREQMRSNAEVTRERGGEELIDHKPVVKLFTPDAGATWLLSELSSDGDTAFGLCDLGVGSPELGYVLLSELQQIRGSAGLPVERDRHFTPERTLLAYSEQARKAQRITA